MTWRQYGEYAADAFGKHVLGWQGPDYKLDFNATTVSHFAIHAGEPDYTQLHTPTGPPPLCTAPIDSGAGAAPCISCDRDAACTVSNAVAHLIPHFPARDQAATRCSRASRRP